MNQSKKVIELEVISDLIDPTLQTPHQNINPRMLELEVIPEHGLTSDQIEFLLGKYSFIDHLILYTKLQFKIS